MNRFQVKTLAVLVLIAFASMGAFVLTDNFVPQAHADDGCFAAAVACALAIIDVIEKCAGGVDADCVAAIFTAIEKCQHAADECL